MKHKNHHILFFLFLSFAFPILLSYTLIPPPNLYAFSPTSLFTYSLTSPLLSTPCSIPYFLLSTPFIIASPFSLSPFSLPQPLFFYSLTQIFPMVLILLNSIPLFSSSKKFNSPPKKKKKKKYCMKGITILYFILYFQKTL